jgi:hypothetical protein
MNNKQLRVHCLSMLILCSICCLVFSFTALFPRKGTLVVNTAAKSDDISHGTHAHAPICQRITSHDASSLIRGIYEGGKDDCGYSRLLIVTSDASRGSKRHTGLSAFLREICVDNNELDHKTDIVTTTTRRIRPVEARDIFQSEVAAISLGIKTALENVPEIGRKKVLLLTDSASAISFFCGDEEGIKFPNHDHPHYRGMQNLLSNAEEVYMGKVKSAKMGVDGFFDHEVCDQLSSFVKSVSNKKLESMQCVDGALRTPCNRLRENDLLYLENYGNTTAKDMIQVKKKQIYLKKDRSDRLKRCRERLDIELGIKFE